MNSPLSFVSIIPSEEKNGKTLNTDKKSKKWNRKKAGYKEEKRQANEKQIPYTLLLTSFTFYNMTTRYRWNVYSFTKVLTTVKLAPLRFRLLMWKHSWVIALLLLRNRSFTIPMIGALSWLPCCDIRFYPCWYTMQILLCHVSINLRCKY